MAGKRIQTELSIKAVDRYSDVLKHMTNVTGRFADGVRTELGELQKMRGPLRMIDDFRKQQKVVGQSAEALARARERVRELKTSITNTKNPTAAMRREFDRARAAAQRMEEKHRKNRDTLSGLQGQLREAGVNTSDLANDERRLAGSIDRVNTAFGKQMQKMERVQRAQQKMADARDRMDKGLSRAANLNFVGQATSQTGRRIVTGLTGPIKAAMGFESAMADVRKVVNFDTPEAFDQMNQDVLEMGTRIPIAADELAGIMAIGASGGVAKKDLKGFTEQAAKVGVAFDISAEQAAESMTYIKTALRLPLDQTALLMDAINQLSNESAAKAPDTLAFMDRTGSAGLQYGFDPQQTLAFGAAMIAAGVQSDVAATSFRNMGKALSRGESATDRQSQAFEKLGLNAAQVSKDMQKDSVGTTLDVMKRLNALPAHLKASVMSDLFGDEARGLAVLVQNMPLLEGMLDRTSDATNYAGSATKEYEQRTDTLENQLQLLNGRWTELSVTMGKKVFPEIKRIATVVGDLIESTVDWVKEHPKLTKVLLLGTAALGAMAVAGGALLTATAGIIGTLAILRFGFVGLGLRAGLLAGDIFGISGAFKGLMRLPKFALSKLLTPLRWTAKLLPDFAPGLARFVGFRKDASSEITRLSRDVAVKSAAMQRSLSRIRWGAFSAGVMTFMAMQNIPKDPKEMPEFQKKNRDSMEGLFRSTPGLGQLMSGYDRLFEAVHGKPSPVTKGINWEQAPATKSEPDASSGRITQLRSDAAGLREEIAGIEAQIKNLGDGPMTASMAAPFHDQLDARKSDLADVKAELAKAQASAEKTGHAIGGIDDIAVSPKIDTGDLDRALLKADRLSGQLNRLSGGGAPFSGTVPSVAGKRAGGGAVRSGLPYLVNENTPRSEVFVPSVSGGVLNVGQAKSVLQRHMMAGLGAGPRMENTTLSSMIATAGLHRARVAAIAAVSAAAMSAPAAAAAPGTGSRQVSIEINGGINVHVPAGVSDPQAIVEMVADQLGQRVAATLSASFAD